MASLNSTKPSEATIEDNIPEPSHGYFTALRPLSGTCWRLALSHSLRPGFFEKSKDGTLFATGTPDKKIYAFDSSNGKELWSFKMQLSGNAPPIIYEHNGSKYLSVIATGGYNFNIIADKVTLKKIRDITFVNARDVLGIIYNSRSGNTSLKWRQIRRNNGKVTGEASSNSLVNLAQSGVITLDWVENYVRKKAQEN